MTEKYSTAWQMVTCSTCGRRYQCIPSDDYYNKTTTTDGVCEKCLIGDLPLHVIQLPEVEV
jgi:hypothetical protein